LECYHDIYAYIYARQSLLAGVPVAKNIAVSDDVYELLKKIRLPGESFSDVIRRGLSRGVRLMDIYGSGTISRENWQRARKTIRESEEITRRKLERLR
jgi:predicted CopG family antitoxin